MAIFLVNRPERPPSPRVPVSLAYAAVTQATEAGEMTQRILFEFDALDKYSRDILAKHAKKRTQSYLQSLHSLPIPLTFDSELDSDQGTEGKRASSKLPLETEIPTALCPRNNFFTDYAKPVIRPFTADCSLKGGGICPESENSVPGGKRSNPWTSRCLICFSQIASASGQYNTAVDRVSLSFDDELTRPDVKVITAREKTRGAHIQTLMDTKLGTYQREKTFVIVSTLSDLQKHVPAKQIYFSSSQWPANGMRSTMGTPLPSPNNTNYNMDLTHNRKIKSPSSAFKSKPKKRSLSANVKFNIQFLSADGTKHKAGLVREEETSTDRQIPFRELKKTLPESKPRPKLVSAGEETTETGRVGTIINGVNPKKTADNDPGSHSKPQQAAKPPGSSSGRPPLPRPSSVAEIQRWRYLTISKPLSSPGHHQDSSAVGSLDPVMAPHFVKDTPRSGRGSQDSSETLSARPVILETRRGRQSSIPAEIHPQGMGTRNHQTKEDLREDNGTVQAGNGSSPTKNVSWSLTVLQNLDMESPGRESNREQEKKSPASTVHHVTIPVISIPTAQTDTSE
ncbi:uncharacterized protein ACMZJ9_011807 [Mantella aurantiaca]